MSLADKLSKFRTDAHLSHAQSADLVGVHQSTYSDWEAGNTTPKLNQ